MSDIIYAFSMKTSAKRSQSLKPLNENSVLMIQATLKASDVEMAMLLDANPRTIARWVSDGAPESYEPLIKWQRLIELAKQTLKVSVIGEWFHEPNRALNGSVPIRLASDPRGFHIVHDLLGNAASGNPQ